MTMDTVPEESPRILIVDDEPNIRFVLERTLCHENYLIETADDGRDALAKLAQQRYDLVLLDLNMKPIGGMEVLNAIRKQGAQTVVIILTAHSTIDSAVEALRLGAFDYLYKPATPEAIRQRVQEGIQYRQKELYRNRLLDQIEGLRQSLVELDKATASLERHANSDRFIRVGRLVIDNYHRTATLEGKLLNLTTTEYDILVALAVASPAPIPPMKLAKDVLNYDMEKTEAQEVIKYHIHQLRRKVEPDIQNPIHIKTIRYKGYFWS